MVMLMMFMALDTGLSFAEYERRRAVFERHHESRWQQRVSGNQR